jgi:putative Ca2+/H+ antiporter (TMEM165/GDT1 family)
LPRRPVEFVAAALFAIGAAVLVRAARKGDESEDQVQDEYAHPRPGWRAALASFVVLFTAEWGDLSQLLTAGLVAAGRPAVPVFFGSWAGLAVVSGAAILLGRWLMKRVRLAMVRYVGATVCLILAIVTLIGAIAD